MVVACPPQGGRGERRCGCRPRRCSGRIWAGAGSSPVAGGHEIGVPVAAALAGRRHCGAGVAGRGRGDMRLSPAQLARLRAELDKGPAAWGWDEDQRWTLERVATLIGWLFHVRYTLRGTSIAAPDRVHPAGPRAPGGGTGQEHDRHLAGCDLSEASRLAAATGAYLCFEDEAGQALRPPKARTWARRGRIPGGRGVREGLRAGVSCRPDLLQARCAQPVLYQIACTPAGKASAGPCPKPITPAGHRRAQPAPCPADPGSTRWACMISLRRRTGRYGATSQTSRPTSITANNRRYALALAGCPGLMI